MGLQVADDAVVGDKACLVNADTFAEFGNEAYVVLNELSVKIVLNAEGHDFGHCLGSCDSLGHVFREMTYEVNGMYGCRFG